MLSSKKYRQILIPPNFGNNFYVKSDFAVYHYKQSKYYEAKANSLLMMAQSINQSQTK